MSYYDVILNLTYTLHAKQTSYKFENCFFFKSNIIYCKLNKIIVYKILLLAVSTTRNNLAENLEFFISFTNLYKSTIYFIALSSDVRTRK